MRGHPFYISRVVFGPDGFGEVTNGSDGPADPAGLQLCQFPAYPHVSAGIVQSGGSVRVAAGELGGLSSDGGELARRDRREDECIVRQHQGRSRGERLDIDAVYMEAVQAMTGQGGWPMTVVMTRDQKPFFAGTYFPPDGATRNAGLRRGPHLAQRRLERAAFRTRRCRCECPWGGTPSGIDQRISNERIAAAVSTGASVGTKWPTPSSSV